MSCQQNQASSGERQSRNKSKSGGLATSNKRPGDKSQSGQQQVKLSSSSSSSSSCSPPFDYLVPISVSVSSLTVQQLQQPNVDEQPVVEAVSWAIFNRLTGQVESSKTLQCARNPPHPQTASTCCSLNEAIQQVDKSLEGKNCVLVTCGPLHLRQYLHPIAKRLKAELSDNFSQYVDLLREFERSAPGHTLGRQTTRSGPQVAQSNVLAATCARCSCCPLGEPAASCRNGISKQTTTTLASSNNNNNNNGDEKENEHVNAANAANDSTPSSSSLASAAATMPAGDEPAPGTAPNSQQQQISQGIQKRLGEILKFLSLGSLEASKCRGCSASQVARQPTTAPALAPTNCLNCSLAMGERQVEASCSIIARLLHEGHSFNRFERIKRRVEVGLCEASAYEAEQRVVRARGLPWQASEQDIADFFTGLNIAKGGVGLCLSRQGRRNGEALIQFESREHRNLALSRHKHFMGQRYIEVYRASGEDFQSVAAGYNNKAEAFISKGAQFVVRMRGLPFTCTSRQVIDFFASNQNQSKPCEVFSGEEGVLFVRNQDEKPTGDAFVLFATDDQARRAIAKHHQNIGTRYVELFRSTVSELQQVLSISMGPPVESGANSGASAADETHPGNKQMSASRQAKSSSNEQKSKSATSGNKPNGVSSQKAAAAAAAAAASQHQTPQLENKNAFPALASDKSVVRQRSEAITYAQVANVKQQAATGLAQRAAEPPAGQQADTHPIKVELAESKSSEEVNGEQRQLQQPQPEELPTSRGEPVVVSIPTTNQKVEAKALSPETSEDGTKSVEEQPQPQPQQQQQVRETDEVELTSSFASSTNSPSSSTAPSAAHSPLSSSTSASSSCNLSYKQSSQHYGSGHHHHHHHYNQHQYASHQQHHHHHNYQRRHYNQNGMRNSMRYHHQQQHPMSYPVYSHHQHQHQHAAMMQQSLIYTHDMLAQQQQHHHHQPTTTTTTTTPMGAAVSQAQYQQSHLAYATSQQAANQLAGYYPAPALNHHHDQHTQQYDSGQQLAPQQPGQTSTTTTTTTAPSTTTTAAAATHTNSLPYAAEGVETGVDALTSRRDCIRLRGLPFEAHIDDVLNFLGKHSENILFQGVHMVYSAQGQPTGEAIIQMNSCQAASQAAQEAHRRVMSVGKKQRYIEVIPSSIDDMKPTLGYGLAAFAASRAYQMHPMHHHHPYAAAYATTAPNGAAVGLDPAAMGYPAAPMHQTHHHHHQLPAYGQTAPADCYPPLSDGASASLHSGGEPTLSSPPLTSTDDSSKQTSDSETSPLEEAAEVSAAGAIKSSQGQSVGSDGDNIARDQQVQEKADGNSSATSTVSSSAASLSSGSTQTITTPSVTSNLNQTQRQQEQQQQQQQQQQAALMAAAQAAAYYPILYYYPPPQQMLATTAPASNNYH